MSRDPRDRIVLVEDQERPLAWVDPVPVHVDEDDVWDPSVGACGVGLEHPFLTAEDIAADAWCCMGSVNDGPAGCTCWTPVFDVKQAEPIPAEPRTRAERCFDCAFRPDSPERARGEDLEGLPNFWCHQGIRRPVAFRHPDGRVRTVSDSSDYQPPIAESVPYKADGTPADRCAGHAQARRLLEARR